MVTEESNGCLGTPQKRLFLRNEIRDLEEAIMIELCVHGTTELYEAVIRAVGERESRAKALLEADRANAISEIELTWVAIKQDLELMAEEVGGEEAMSYAKDASAHIWSLIELAVKQSEEPCECGL